MRNRRRARLGQGLLHRWVFSTGGQISPETSDLYGCKLFLCRICFKLRWAD